MKFLLTEVFQHPKVLCTHPSTHLYKETVHHSGWTQLLQSSKEKDHSVPFTISTLCCKETQTDPERSASSLLFKGSIFKCLFRHLWESFCTRKTNLGESHLIVCRQPCLVRSKLLTEVESVQNRKGKKELGVFCSGLSQKI